MKGSSIVSLFCCIVLWNERTDAFCATNFRRSSWGRSRLDAAIGKGDTVLVIGGTGGVGQLVTKKLQAREDFTVRVSSRNEGSAREILDDDRVEVVEYDLISGSQEELQNILEGVAAVVVSVGTTAFPTMKWKGGNTPEAIDKLAVERIAKEAETSKKIKRIVLLTSVGVDRTDEMPFVILNLFGVLDAKKSGENAVKAAAASNSGLDFVIVRPGRLVGGPFTNLDVARLLQIEGGAENGVEIQSGDVLLGDCKRDACAEAVVQALTCEECSDVEFSIVSTEENALTDAMWRESFKKLKS